ncbi:MAG: hypothetical protein P1U64_02565 [Alcanivoracaceae bacterium]|jgi:hypothetical protein|nr:hypothetical protein [Alcanivoracaceae bacterium]
MANPERTATARRRLVAVLASHFHEGWSNDQVRAHYPHGVPVEVDGESITFPPALLDDPFLDKARQLYQQIVASNQPRH